MGTLMIIAGLHAGRELLVPLSLSVLLALLLAPICKLLERCWLGRLPSVLLPVLVATILFAGIGWLVTRQIAETARRLPDYRGNIVAKLPALGPFGAPLMKGYALIESAGAEIARTPPKATPPFRIPDPEDSSPGAFGVLGDVFLSLFNTLGTGFVVFMLVIFLLIYREDLRDRLIQLSGAGRVRVTTQAMQDAAGSVSRYLLLQTVINLLYGGVVALILLALGIPNAPLWGIVAALARFIPYFGPWLGASLPLFLSMAVFPTWTPTLLFAALWLCLELTVANAIEPLLYSRRTGITPIAVLVAAAFWAWTWGGLGLLLSIPLTVSLVVMGRHFAPLRFLHTLLADDVTVEPRIQLYQRLLARDLHGAAEIVEVSEAGRSLSETCDRLMVPTLGLIQEDLQAGRLADDAAVDIRKNFSVLIEDLAERATKPLLPAIVPAASAWGHTAVCIPTDDGVDEISAQMIGRLLAQRGVHMEVLPGADTVGEKVRRAVERIPDVVILVSLKPPALIPVRYLYKRVRAALPRTEIVVALLDAPAEPERWSQRISETDGPPVVTSLPELERSMEQIVPPLMLKKAAAFAEGPSPAAG